MAMTMTTGSFWSKVNLVGYCLIMSSLGVFYISLDSCRRQLPRGGGGDRRGHGRNNATTTTTTKPSTTFDDKETEGLTLEEVNLVHAVLMMAIGLAALITGLVCHWASQQTHLRPPRRRKTYLKLVLICSCPLVTAGTLLSSIFLDNSFVGFILTFGVINGLAIGTCFVVNTLLQLLEFEAGDNALGSPWIGGWAMAFGLSQSFIGLGSILLNSLQWLERPADGTVYLQEVGYTTATIQCIAILLLIASYSLESAWRLGGANSSNSATTAAVDDYATLEDENEHNITESQGGNDGDESIHVVGNVAEEEEEEQGNDDIDDWHQLNPETLVVAVHSKTFSKLWLAFLCNVAGCVYFHSTFRNFDTFNIVLLDPTLERNVSFLTATFCDLFSAVGRIIWPIIANFERPGQIENFRSTFCFISIVLSALSFSIAPMSPGSSTGHVILLCLWTWTSSFFYSSNLVLLPIALKRLLGVRYFAGTLGVFCAALAMGPLVYQVLVMSMFKSLHFKGFAVSTGLLHLISFYSSYRLEAAFEKDLEHQSYRRRHLRGAAHSAMTSMIAAATSMLYGTAFHVVAGQDEQVETAESIRRRLHAADNDDEPLELPAHAAGIDILQSLLEAKPRRNCQR